MEIRYWCSAAAVAGGLIFCTEDLAAAACYSPQQQVSKEAVDSFMGDPGAMLRQFPNGGARMISGIRDLAASNPATLSPILQLVGTANQGQISAIGSALGQSQRICGAKDASYAQQIEHGVVLSKNLELILAFETVTGQPPTGAPGGGADLGGPGAGGGLGGPGGGEASQGGARGLGGPGGGEASQGGARGLGGPEAVRLPLSDLRAAAEEVSSHLASRLRPLVTVGGGGGAGSPGISRSVSP